MTLRDPLLLPLAALVAGIASSRIAPFETAETLGAMALLAGIAVLGLCCGTSRCAAAAAVTAVGFLGIYREHAMRPVASPRTSGETEIVRGCVVTPPALAGTREQFVLEMRPRERVRVSLYSRDNETPPALRYGQIVDLEARMRQPRNFGNPGSFDYAGYLARQDIHWVATVRPGAAIRIAPESCGSAAMAMVYRLREKALDQIENLYHGDAYTAAMMQGILLGDSSAVEQAWTEQFRRTGTYHALVISGMHLVVLAGSFLFLLRIGGAGVGVSLILTAALAWLYALMAGGSTPVVRAAAGLTLYLVARFCYRKARILNLLAAVAIGFLLVDPGQLFDASFLLSFLSVAVIGALAAPWLERVSSPFSQGLRAVSDSSRDLHLPPRTAQFRIELRLLAETIRLWTRIPRRVSLAALAVSLRLVFWAFELMVVSAAVQAGLALPMAAYFHRVSFSGLVANLLVVPLMNALIPTGFLAILTGWAAPASIARWLLATSRWIVEWCAGWEPNWRVPDPPLWLAMGLAVLLVMAALLVGARRWLWRTASVLLLMALVPLVWHPFPPDVVPDEIELTAIDVGQGDALLATLPQGKLMLIDAGGIPAFGGGRRTRLDIGEDVVSPYLWSRSIRRLDVVAATHAHQDHIGGLPAILENFRPAELWTGAFGESPAWAIVREQAKRLGVRVVSPRAGRSLDLGGARIDVLAPLADYEPGKRPRNDDSLVLRLRFGAHAFLLTGDIERGVETQMRPGRIDVLKVAHHGSRTSTTPGFLELARPAFAIISDGFENPYRFPHQDVLDRLAAHSTMVLRTDLDGLVSVRSDGRRLRVETRRGLWAPD